MLMIGITGVTGKLGSYVADLVDQQGIFSIHLARRPERAKVYASWKFVRWCMPILQEVVDALKGNRCLIDGLCSVEGNPGRVKDDEKASF